MSLGLGGTLLATAAGTGAHFFDTRTSAKMGMYADNHTDVVTQVCFNPFNETELATGSEDGLVCVYDTRQAHADASLQVGLYVRSIPTLYLALSLFRFQSLSLKCLFLLNPLISLPLLLISFCSKLQWYIPQRLFCSCVRLCLSFLNTSFNFMLSFSLYHHL